MSLESDADRLALVKTLGELVTVKYHEIYGVFERDYAESVDSAGYDPRLSVRTIDISGVAINDQVIRLSNSTAYRIRNMEDSGDGITELVLEAE